MKLLIYWLTLMVFLPLLYLFWWKKKLRLIIGIAIIAILTIGFFAPGEIVSSTLTGQIEKEGWDKIKKIDEIISKISEKNIDAENPKEKIEQAKEIIKKKEEIEKLLIEERENPLLEIFWLVENNTLNKLRQEWINKWSQEKFLSMLLFCGEDFNNKLKKGEYQIFEGKKKVKKKIDTENIIDFANYQNSNSNILAAIKGKISAILTKEEIKRLKYFPKNFSIVWLKNIDKITNFELEKMFTEIFDLEKTNCLANEVGVSLLKFIFIFTTSNSNPKLSKPLLSKLKRVKTWEKYSLIIFIISSIIEITIFLVLIRNKKKSKIKEIKHLNY